ncbi:hypothetical protein C453_14768 [Haloferax elongans ATCC BAA-1513]|uniref:Uncharacterized protein n=1 Tax=Haloferax elongans ATCC BAA-1513 TaxID=1230453 RepID=M0HF38_HALEO|nr:hypothetical protein C453_14768 [Haloferax elongans ATCC BAA-1513]
MPFDGRELVVVINLVGVIASTAIVDESPITLNIRLNNFSNFFFRSICYSTNKIIFITATAITRVIEVVCCSEETLFSIIFHTTTRGSIPLFDPTDILSSLDGICRFIIRTVVINSILIITRTRKRLCTVSTRNRNVINLLR